jgi:hypothetical protein
LEKAAEHDGLLGPSFPMDSARLEGEQDLINAAAVETIRRRGEVYMLDPGELGVSSLHWRGLAVFRLTDVGNAPR